MRNPVSFSTLLVMALAANVSACGGGNDPAPNLPDPPPAANEPPSVAVKPVGAEILEFTAVSLAVDATDPDRDALTYTWRQTAGTPASLDDADKASLTFMAPKVVGSETLSFEVSVSDGHDHIVKKAVDLVVNEGEVIVFTAMKNDGHAVEVYRLHEADDAPVKLHESALKPDPDGPSAYDLKMAPDHRHVAYIVETADTTQLHVVNLDGSGSRDITASVADVNHIRKYEWSPDGSRLAFAVEYKEGNKKLFMLRADGSGLQELTDANATVDNVRSFTWSSDGKKLAYVVAPEGGNGDRLFVVNLDNGTAIREIAVDGNSSNMDIDDVAWSPNDSRVAFSNRSFDSGLGGYRNRLYITDVNGTAPPTDISGTLNAVPPAPDIVSGVSAFSWSPDGKQIAFIANAHTYAEYDLFLTDANAPDESARRQITNVVDGGQVSRAYWSPDSSRIAFVGCLAGLTAGIRVNELYITDSNAADSATNQRVSGTIVGQVGASSMGVDPDHVRWSPDSQYLGWRADPEIQNTFELFTAAADAADGRKPRRLTGQRLARGDTAMNIPVGVQSLAWSPYGHRMVFAGDIRLPGVSEIWMTAGGERNPGTPRESSPAHLSEEPADFNNDGIPDTDAGSARWLPEGKQILFVANRQALNRNELFMLEIGSGNPPKAISGDLGEDVSVEEYAFAAPAP